MMDESAESRIDALLEEPYWVIDPLPRQVPAGSPGQYFAVERWLMAEPQRAEIHRKRANLLLKLSCYRDLCLDGNETNPAPAELAAAIASRYVTLLVDDALITSDPDDMYLTVYHPDEELLDLLRTLAGAEGLFLWQPPQDKESQ
ncbi:MAG: hypothetical protein IKD70_10260 [Eggerthellaceae bacterium]|nr:hypothetical protein [Eggerthellaceae bacterium]